MGSMGGIGGLGAVGLGAMDNSHRLKHLLLALVLLLASPGSSGLSGSSGTSNAAGYRAGVSSESDGLQAVVDRAAAIACEVPALPLPSPCSPPDSLPPSLLSVSHSLSQRAFRHSFPRTLLYVYVCARW